MARVPRADCLRLSESILLLKHLTSSSTSPPHLWQRAPGRESPKSGKAPRQSKGAEGMSCDGVCFDALILWRRAFWPVHQCHQSSTPSQQSQTQTLTNPVTALHIFSRGVVFKRYDFFERLLILLVSQNLSLSSLSFLARARGTRAFCYLGTNTSLVHLPWRKALGW